MDTIVLTAVLVVIIGLAGSVVLVVASKVLSVEEDQRLAYVNEILPGLNCGSCGFPGCEGYARAVLDGAPTTSCTPGGSAVAASLADYLGVDGGEVEVKKAVVACSGARDRIRSADSYDGPKDCRMFSTMDFTSKACAFGCLGFGNCVKTCPFDALFINENMVAEVDTDRCTGCGKCTESCPKNLISLQSSAHVDAVSFVLCKSTAMGKQAKEMCSSVCIGCRKCAKVCPEGCVTVENGLAHIDTTHCTGCGECEKACPTGVIHPLSLAPTRVLSQA